MGKSIDEKNNSIILLRTLALYLEMKPESYPLYHTHAKYIPELKYLNAKKKEPNYKIETDKITKSYYRSERKKNHRTEYN